MHDREQRIRQRAYELWEAAGKPEGREAEHWAEAERQLDAEGAPGNDGGGAGPQQPQSGDVETISAEVPVVRRKRAAPARKQPSRA